MNKLLTPERTEKIRRVIGLRQQDLTLVLANIHDPHNVSAIYRSCDAFGVLSVALYYTHSAFPKLGAKSSASARKWVETARYDDVDVLKTKLKQQKMQILATSCSPTAKSFREYDLTKPTALVLGNEHSGVDVELIAVADGEIYIPMYGMIQSFNVSVAAALLLSEAARQRELAGMYENSAYNAEELKAMFDVWANK